LFPLLNTSAKTLAIHPGTSYRSLTSMLALAPN
jgi:hypothetical protein